MKRQIKRCRGHLCFRSCINYYINYKQTDKRYRHDDDDNDDGGYADDEDDDVSDGGDDDYDDDDN